MNLLAVMATPGVKSTHTTSNHVAEMEKHPFFPSFFSFFIILSSFCLFIYLFDTLNVPGDRGSEVDNHERDRLYDDELQDEH